MEEWAATYSPVGWKVYTMGQMDESYQHYLPGRGWRLDDDEYGMPFLERARDVGVKLVCAHKGISGSDPSSSPEDVSMMPMAPAFETAAASCERAIQPMGACTMGMSTPSRVS